MPPDWLLVKHQPALFLRLALTIDAASVIQQDKEDGGIGMSDPIRINGKHEARSKVRSSQS